MAIPDRFLRAFAISIPLLSAAGFFGLYESFLKVGLNESLVQSGMTLAILLGIANLVLWFQIFKRRVP